MKAGNDRAREGAALLVVVGLAFLGLFLAGMAATATMSAVRRARQTLAIEQAFFVAEGGAERAASYIANGGAIPGTITGTIGPGEYVAHITVDHIGQGESTVSGSIRINPNNSPHNSFFTVLPDGNRITRSDLHSGAADYEGPAEHVHVKPMGSGTQSGLIVNGVPYTLKNSESYDITSSDMNVRIYNDRRNPQGRAMGQWWIDITHAEDANLTSSEDAVVVRRDTHFTIVSEGRVGGAHRSVTINGLHAASWAKYALWYDSESLQLWMVGGETFEGPVHANRQFRFHSFQVGTHGQTRFFDRATTTHSSYQRQNNSVEPIFDRGLTLNAPVQTMASVDMDELRMEADLVLEGQTSITLDGMIMHVTNARQGWVNHPLPIPVDEGSIFVRSATTGANASRPGDLTVSAPDGFIGRVTLVADRHINVVDHLRYATNPIDDPSSEDALGLIAGNSVVVRPEAPNDLEIFAHIIARDSGFGVEGYNNQSWGHRGSLLVYGGIVNRIRNAVGSTAGTGYSKNYVYDSRFAERPPPRYPVINNEFQWLGWDG